MSENENRSAEEKQLQVLFPSDSPTLTPLAAAALLRLLRKAADRQLGSRPRRRAA